MLRNRGDQGSCGAPATTCAPEPCTTPGPERSLAAKRPPLPRTLMLDARATDKSLCGANPPRAGLTPRLCGDIPGDEPFPRARAGNGSPGCLTLDARVPIPPVRGGGRLFVCASLRPLGSP